MSLMLALVILGFCADISHAVGIVGWGTVDKIVPFFFNIPTKNILRCGNFCQRQGKCFAVTFDNRERICYMHNNKPANGGLIVETRTNGRYLFKLYQDNPSSHAAKPNCAKDTQIAAPSAGNEGGVCRNIKDIGDCVSNPCQNGGTCTDGGNTFTCRCPDGFAGNLCQCDRRRCEANCTTRACYEFDCTTGLCFRFVYHNAARTDEYLNSVCNDGVGGRLLVVDSQGKQEVVQKKMETHSVGVLMLGLSKPNSVWRWVNGSRPIWNNWGTGQPDGNGKCAYIVTDWKYKWDDAECPYGWSTDMHIGCERP